MEKEELIVAGFVFKILEDAEIAREEEKKISYIEDKMNYARPDGVLAIYQKMVESQMFQTPVGYVYLASMQKYLQDNGKIKEETPIYVGTINKKEARRLKERENAEKALKEENRNLRQKTGLFLAINAVLAIMVIVMFIITIKGSTPNILNYERTIQNKYAVWEQELTEREQDLREKERAINADN